MTPEPDLFIVVGPKGPVGTPADKEKAEELAGNLRQQFESDAFVAKPVNTDQTQKFDSGVKSS